MRCTPRCNYGMLMLSRILFSTGFGFRGCSSIKLLALLLFGLVTITTSASAAENTLAHFRDCDVCSEMVALPSGAFMMGATEDEFQGENKRYRFMYVNETPRHEVHVKSYALAKFDVTRKQFETFVDATGFHEKGCRVFKQGRWYFDPSADWKNPGFSQTDRDPVVCVSWFDAEKFIAWLNTKLPKTAVHRYRLPTEEEWEYAARASTITQAYWGSNHADQCRYENARDLAARILDPNVPLADCNDGFVWTAPVGSFRPNPWGLYDMLGNAYQWIADCPEVGYHPPPAVPEWMPNHFQFRSLRGASWASIPIAVRSAGRMAAKPEDRDSTFGFRLAVDLPLQLPKGE
jgi:formylglycine-generating enzyme required for sulfatase activity